MRKLIICAIMAPALAGCGTMPLHPSVKLASASKTCLATPQEAQSIKPGEDVVVDNAKLRRIVGDDVAGWSACQSYIRRLHSGA